MKYKGILKMNKDNIYDFVIDNNFTHRMNRAFLMIVIWLMFISFFSYYIFTSNAWAIEIFGIKISIFYLPSVIGIMPTLHEEIRLVKNYGKKSFKTIGIIGHKLVGKNFFNQKIFMDNPVVLDWDYRINKPWYMSKNDEVLAVSFIKLSQGNKMLLIPHSKSNMNFIKKFKEISHS